jgi:hypothetical protein
VPSLPDLIAVCAAAGGVVGGLLGLVSAWGSPSDADLRKNFVDFAQVGAVFGSAVAFVIWAVGAIAGA